MRLGEFLLYEAAGGLLLPLLLLGAVAAVVLTGLAIVLPTRSRFVRASFAGLGALLAVSSCWLVLYATGTDTYYEPSQYSRWEHAARFMGTWPVVVAVIGGVATSIGLLVSAFSPTRNALRLAVGPAAAVSCILLVFGWVALTAGH